MILTAGSRKRYIIRSNSCCVWFLERWRGRRERGGSCICIRIHRQYHNIHGRFSFFFYSCQVIVCTTLQIKKSNEVFIIFIVLLTCQCCSGRCCCYNYSCSSDGDTRMRGRFIFYINIFSPSFLSFLFSS